MVTTIANSSSEPITLGAQAVRLGKVTKALYVLMGILVLAAAVAAGLSYYLQDRVSNAQIEQAANSAVSLSAVVDIEADENSLAKLATANCGAASSVQKWMIRQSSAVRQQLKDSHVLLNSLQNLCASSGTRYQLLGNFYSAYVTAVVARQQAAYKEAAQQYEKALGAAANDDDLKGRALEGLAYSQMKNRNLGAAERSIMEAAALNTDYVFTAMTQMKIACAAKEPPEQVRSLFQKALNDRNNKIGAYRDDAGRERFAVYDRQLLVGDPELKLMCRYAGIAGR